MNLAINFLHRETLDLVVNTPTKNPLVEFGPQEIVYKVPLAVFRCHSLVFEDKVCIGEMLAYVWKNKRSGPTIIPALLHLEAPRRSGA